MDLRRLQAYEEGVLEWRGVKDLMHKLSMKALSAGGGGGVDDGADDDDKLVGGQGAWRERLLWGGLEAFVSVLPWYCSYQRVVIYVN